MSVGIGDIPEGVNTSTAFRVTMVKLASPYPGSDEEDTVVAVSSSGNAIGLQECELFNSPGPEENPGFREGFHQRYHRHLQQIVG